MPDNPLDDYLNSHQHSSFCEKPRTACTCGLTAAREQARRMREALRAEYVALYDHGTLLKIEGKYQLDDDKDWMPREEWHRKAREEQVLKNKGS